MLRRTVLFAIASLLLSPPPASADLSRLFAPKASLKEEVWLEHSAGSAVTVDHSAWDGWLGRYVATDGDGVARVAYGAVTAADRQVLEGYLAALQAVDPAGLNRDEQLAYWINMYNAVTVDLILDHYPVGSIRDIGSGLLDTGPWDRELVRVKGRALSLNDIEHGIIRPVFNEPRIHYAVNCAAISCPNLAGKAWTGAGLEADLAAAERSYVNDPRGVRVEGGSVVLSSIYNWFREDFGASEAAVLARLAGVAEGALAETLAGKGAVDSYAYDWALNDR
ncbi:MAG: DUF547 domain-containing protein [Pseudomonadota bacterium]